jgi:protein TonB
MTKPTSLPAKEKVAEAEPEKLSPAIDDAETVAVASVAAQTEEQPEFTPVKEQLAGVEAANDEEKKPDTDAEAPQAKAEDPAPAAAAEAAQGLGRGGENKGEAVNYLELKQFSGNKAPTYPMQARKDKRQGQVDLLYRVTTEGRVAEVQIAKSSGHADLDEAAVKAIAKYRFVPGQEGWAHHPVIFALKGEASELPSKLRSANASE